VKRCPKCLNLMPQDESRCIRCGNDSRRIAPKDQIRTVEAIPVLRYNANALRRTSWLHLLAAALTSKLFFLAACALGTAAGLLLNDELYLAAGARQGADRRMVVVAMAADPKTGGKTVAHQVRYGDLDSFKAIYPDFSFLLPPGSGRVDNPAAGMSTKYTVLQGDAGKVLVETKFNHEFLDVYGRYEATAGEIRPLLFNTGSVPLFALTFGFSIASLLGLLGLLLRYYFP